MLASWNDGAAKSAIVDFVAREFAYDRNFRLSPLAEALDRAAEYGITVASMKRDWNAVFPALARP